VDAMILLVDDLMTISVVCVMYICRDGDLYFCVHQSIAYLNSLYLLSIIWFCEGLTLLLSCYGSLIIM